MMSQSTLEAWIERLGQQHSTLVANNDLSASPLAFVFIGQESETATPLPGLELEFSAGPLVLECVHVNLISRICQEQTYQGMLPDRLQGLSTRTEARDRLGPRRSSQPPLRMPLPLGDTGGWDVFAWKNTNNAPISIMCQYNTKLQVCDLAFFRDGPGTQRFFASR
ncbi:hypothetical protein [Pseudomonas sp. 10-1B]|uniref:hypothetical protein n=1 Tax=Pseudomonas sp. 10-1B TaxID=1546029 RepID=UPI00128C2D80|nr:hypothetical protein [Pseudomonas sp. 10-1B]